MGSEFLTPDNSEELSFIVPIQKMGSEFLTRDKSEELSFIVPIQKMGSEFLTPNNLCKLPIIVPGQQFAFRVSDPWQIRGTVLYSAYTEMGSGFLMPVFAYGEKETVLIKTTAFNQIT